MLITQRLEGDNLIKEEQYEKARDWFLSYLDKNPEDVHSLYVLARYYEYCEEDYAKAKEYLKRLYKITKIEEYKSHMEGLSDK
ncbi:hypothetical protein SDC9_126219 [bioreactor metagenome]|uniref:Beta-barrel assembly-enhancing protease n=1 Tax=bioreactor metagenome TaxID=1076179 RepID=A0A645CQ32_9ZZZZ